MIKNYILDTNVLLHDPQSLLCFQENNVLIPIEVIEEIDRFKRESSERGQNARAVSRVLDELRGQGRLSEGVALPAGGKLRILLHGSSARLPVTFNGTTVDDRLIALTRDIQEADSGVPTVLVTKDINLRIKADAVGLQAQDYETDHVHIQDLYTGSFELTTDPEALNAFRATRELPLNGAGPRFYASGQAAPSFAKLREFGLDVRVLAGPPNAASALKMSYAGITKGTQALGAAMLLAATRGGTADALFAELAGSQPQMLAWLKRSLTLMPPKAYRWIAEMHEIADFVGEDPAAHELYVGAAHFYEQIARDFADEQSAALDAFLRKGEVNG